MADIFSTPLSSRRNPRVRAVLEIGSDAAARRRLGAFLVEGVKLVREALEERVPVAEVFVSPRLEREGEGAALLAAMVASRMPLTAVTDGLLGEMAPAHTPQGVLAVARLPAAADLPAPRPGRPLLVAWHVQDPGNLGALLRTAEAAGAAGLACAGGGVDPWHPRTVRAAAGSIFRMPPALLPAGGELERLRGSGRRLAAAVPRGGEACTEFDWSGPWALLLGGEGGGLPEPVTAAADRLVCVPTEGRVESLSVPAAAAMLLYEAMRRRLSARDLPRRSGPDRSPHGPRAPRRRPPRRRRGGG